MNREFDDFDDEDRFDNNNTMLSKFKSLFCCIGMIFTKYKKIGNIHSFEVAGFPKKQWVLGPHFIGVLVTLIIIYFGSVLNKKVIHNIEFDSITNFVLISFVNVMYILTNTLLLCVAMTNPGIVINNKIRNDIELNNTDREITIDYEGVHTYDDADDDCDFCNICKVNQPWNLKIRHCYDCNCCIAHHDHHCPWMGQCIGEKNMKYFIYFNISWVLFLFELLYFVFIFD
jgi:hypothetical protein